MKGQIDGWIILIDLLRGGYQILCEIGYTNLCHESEKGLYSHQECGTILGESRGASWYGKVR